MVDELKALYSYQGKDAVYSVCVGETGNILVSVSLLHICNQCVFIRYL